jgi:N utilization substance protein B
VRSRRVARRAALDALYAAEIRGWLPVEALDRSGAEHWNEGEEPDPASVGYARKLVSGVQEHQARIDHLITASADRWAIERMPVIDRNIIRMAIFEILWSDDVPTPVAINEAVELAKALSTEESGRFVNGLLGRIAQIGTTG